nr:hypothetical protein CFP56_68698 [Quercus suber]
MSLAQPLDPQHDSTLHKDRVPPLRPTATDEGMLEKQHAVEPAKQPSRFSRAYMTGAVEKDHADLALLACSLVTGMVDAASFRNYGMFVGMQTGNTVILGLTAAGLPQNPHAWLTTLVSLASFLIGNFVTFRLTKLLCPAGCAKSRVWTSILFLAQALLTLLSAALAQPRGLVPQNPYPSSPGQLDPASVIDDILIVALIPPLAFQSGIQIASSRILGFNELPVNVLTSTYCDLMGDFNLFALNNVRRNRRAAAVLLLLAGAIASGWLLRSSGGLPAVLWLSGGIKLLTAVAMFCFLPPAREKNLPA